MRYFPVLILVAAAAVALVAPPGDATRLWAQASLQNPSQGLATYHPQLAAPLSPRAAEQYQLARPILERLEEKQREGKVGEVPPIEVGRCHVAILRMRRLARELRALGEPAGYDFELRAGQFAQRLENVLSEYRELPATLKYCDSNRRNLLGLADRESRAMANADRLMQQGKLADAEKALFAAIDTVEQAAAVFGANDRLAALERFRGAAEQLNLRLYEARNQEALARLQDLRRSVFIDFDQHARDLEAACRAAAAGPTTWRDASYAGAEWLAALVGELRSTHLAAQRRWAYEHALRAVDDRRTIGDLGDLEAEYNRFRAAVLAAAVEMIRARGQQLGSADGVAEYAALAAAAAEWSAWSGDPAVEKELAAALADCERGAPEVAARAATYRAATHDLLRWRRRIATAAQAARGETGDRAFAAVRVAGEPRPPEFDGLVFVPDPQRAAGVLKSAAPDTIAALAPHLRDRRVTVEHLQLLSPTAAAAIAPVEAPWYGQVAAPPNWQPAADALARELTLHDQPPLSLAAAKALYTARSGGFLAAAGPVTNFHLEAAITRQATLTPAAWRFSRWGELPLRKFDPAEGLLELMLVRLDVRADWVRHECFFVAAAAPSPDTSAGAE